MEHVNTYTIQTISNCRKIPYHKLLQTWTGAQLACSPLIIAYFQEVEERIESGRRNAEED